MPPPRDHLITLAPDVQGSVPTDRGEAKYLKNIGVCPGFFSHTGLVCVPGHQPLTRARAADKTHS